MSSKFGQNKFKKQSTSERIVNTRTERSVAKEKQLICFNFKDFDYNQCPPGQTHNEWQDIKLLSAFFDKLYQLSDKSITEAQQHNMITIYKEFPPKSDFNIPKYIKGSVHWAVIKDIGGQKARAAGYVDGNTFYVVFLDKDHLFYKMKK
jgi:hypothetical protein